jgi:anti-anti-sigma factor
MPVLSLDVEHCAGKTVIVHCHGKLIAGVTEILLTGVRPLIPDNHRIILDLSDLQHTDSTGLGALVRLYVAAKNAGCNLELTHLSKQIRNLLGLTHLLDVFTVIGEKGVKLMGLVSSDDALRNRQPSSASSGNTPNSATVTLDNSSTEAKDG